MSLPFPFPVDVLSYESLNITTVDRHHERFVMIECSRLIVILDSDLDKVRVFCGVQRTLCSIASPHSGDLAAGTMANIAFSTAKLHRPRVW